MPLLNEPDYEVIKRKVLRCLHAWCDDANEGDEKVALDHLDKIWPEVMWTRGSNIIAAFQAAAKHAIAVKKDSVQVEVEVKTPKKRGRPPKNKLTESERDPAAKIKTAPVDESIKIE